MGKDNSEVFVMISGLAYDTDKEILPEGHTMQNETRFLLILATGVFGILNTEMGMIGILPYMAEHFRVTISEAGLLVSLFALVVAIAGPTMPLVFSRFNRKTVMLAAADTFRAAAVEQLQVWGERVGVRVVAQGQGSDPAAVAFDAWQATRSAGADLLIVDTAGRLHDKHNLMEELRKIQRVLVREAGEERVQTVLVLDAVLGQNSVAQAETFNSILPVSSIVLTKYDNTAKGGVVLAIARRLRIPVRCIGLGEAPEDLSPFDPAEFAAALMEGEAGR